MKQTIQDIVSQIIEGSKLSSDDRQPRKKDENRTIYSVFYSTSRYAIDFAPDFTSEGWEQFDTDQDASYFGVWTNKQKMIVMSYAEGDWYVVKCANAIGYNEEIKEMCEFYGTQAAFVAYSIEENTKTSYFQDRQQFFIS